MAVEKVENQANGHCSWAGKTGSARAFIMGMVALTIGGVFLMAGCGAPKPEKVVMDYINLMATGKYEKATKLVHEDPELQEAQAQLVLFTKNNQDDSIFTKADWKVSNDPEIKKLAEQGLAVSAKGDPKFAAFAKDCIVVVTTGVEKENKDHVAKMAWIVSAGKKATKIVPVPMPIEN